MDVFSHGLWSGIIYKAVNKKRKNPLKIKLAAFFGVFPDVFSFTPLFVWMFFGLISGSFSFSDFPRPENVEPTQRDTLFIFRLVNLLYSLSHSLPIFLIIFGLVYLIFKRPIWEIFAWLVHILIDIPTHTYQFYPTPFLWPFSDIKFNGFVWSAPWFLILNYSAIILIYFYLYYFNKKNN
ncbi:hypothetical protein A2999_02945 [Candidatus Wolfebacteria bacterium RIFCSPLOWO2_01_FULL_38_11]|uniref:Membrane-bound metal-dependent hydrolase n=2 Tax=Candidatus Wolfeibacteriota TaxID=1752735 RepID=A0A0G0J4L0_9BACT|nr:MAG: hypothetical protein US36_C0003G0010 [Candidatus Wolfebacteria bacterium GW2011_GWC1_37_10]OGM91414.1 MAG: hypothetical protein A2999_02945 [Candidatus Wolfebacteria bacterium RIFCSPLOWO2_01_FULL_38_11]